MARDFLLAASNTAPLYGDSEAEGKLVDEDVVLLGKLAKKIHANDGIVYSPIRLLLYHSYNDRFCVICFLLSLSFDRLFISPFLYLL